MAPSTSTDLIVPGDDSDYAVLAMPQDEITDLIASNLSPGESVGVGDLPRIKTPSGGATTWEIPSVDGGTASKELTGVIIRKETGRSYWKKSYEEMAGSTERPDCASRGGMVGVANSESHNPGPGGQCSICPLNEFGSGKDGIGKACTEYRQLFLLPPDGLLPYVINVKPGSLAQAKAYFFGLLNARLKSTDVETIMTLTKEQGSRAVYAQIQFRAGRRLDPAARARLASYAELIAPQMERAAEQDVDLDDNGPTAAAA